MQDNEGYAPLRFRSALVPAANFGSKLSWPLILLGLVFGGLGSPLVEIGILMFSLAVLFQLVTLPVEYNASARAVRLLDSQGILAGEEVSGTRKVLNAAALTYVSLFSLEEETDVTTNTTNIREVVLDVLLEVLENHNLSHLVLKQALEKYLFLERQDRAFITRCVEGTLEYRIQIDAVIDRFSKVKTAKMKPVIREILRMSVYQILYMERVPDSAVCNEAVKLAKKRKFQGLSGFVNGVLRTVSREKENLSWKDASIRYSIPQWMLSMWEEMFGKETAETIAASFLEERPLTVRFNESIAPAAETVEELRAQNITVDLSDVFPGIASIRGFDYLDRVAAFAEGKITVQDPSSSLAARMASIKPGDFVLDVCSAPGGKAMHAADLLRGTGMVEARDVSERKTDLIEENIMRCGFPNIRTMVWDATFLDPSMIGQADVVLADLPCSGLGIIGKKPDIKERMTKDEIVKLAGLQREILSVVSQYVKPGGTLVYSTCTITKEENAENADWIEKNLPFEKKEIRDLLPEALKASCEENRIQLLPGVHPCDGFFISAFRRK